MNDLISRQATLKPYKTLKDTDTLCVGLVRANILQQKTVKQLTGHWIIGRIFPTKLADENLIEYRCSECDRAIRCTESQLVNYPYCHCGVKMVEPQESDHTCHTCKHYTSGERDGSCGSYICNGYSNWESEEV